MADGFLGRWSRRKLDAKEGKPLEEPSVESGTPAAPPPQPSPGGGGSQTQGPSFPPPPGEGEGGGAPATEPARPPDPPPTLADVADLTPASDFRRFIARGVAPEVKNAAMKKLFADPRFNVMDGLDTYIDDYTKADPIPESMLRQLSSARFLGLFREEEDASPAGARDAADRLGGESVAQSIAPEADAAAESAPAIVPDPAPDAHADLRLQQDDAAEGGESGHGAG